MHDVSRFRLEKLLLPGDYRLYNIDGSMQRWSPVPVCYRLQNQNLALVFVYIYITLHLQYTFTVHKTFCPVCTFLRIINFDGEAAETTQNGGENMNGPSGDQVIAHSRTR